MISYLLRGEDCNINNSEDEEEEFKGCIREGELSSEMEDIFLRYSKGENIITKDLDPLVISNGNCESIVDVAGCPQQHDASSVVARTVVDVERPIAQSAGRFRSKEDLENTVDRQQEQIQLLENEKKALVIQLQDVQQIARDLSDEGNIRLCIILKRNHLGIDHRNKRITKLNLRINLRIFSIHIQIIQAIAGDGKSTTDYSDMQKLDE